MAKQNKVIAAAVVVSVEGQERYLYRGAVLPSGVQQADITRLRNNGLIREVEVPEADSPQDVAAAEAALAAAQKAEADKAAAEKADAEKGQSAKPAGKPAAGQK